MENKIMKTNRTIAGWLMLLALSNLNLQPATAFAQGTTAFTYQGQLRDGGTNANGAYTMIFKLYDSLSSGNQIGSGITNSPTLANGLFTVNLDFGAGAFNGSARWLDITVSNGVAQTLSPRVQVLPAPYAQFAAAAATVTNGAIMNAQLAGNAVATTNIQNNAITTVLIADSAVTNRNIASNSVTSDKLALDSAGLARVTGGAASVANNVVSFSGGQVTMAHNFGANGNSVWNIENGYSEILGVPGSFMDNLFLSAQVDCQRRKFGIRRQREREAYQPSMSSVILFPPAMFLRPAHSMATGQV
jgi:hypothetical protein